MRHFALSALFLAGAMIVVTAFLHGYVGGGQLLKELEAGGISADLRASVAIGWTAGSLCWAMLGGIVLLTAVRLRRGDGSLRGPGLAIGLLWLGFGLGALALRGLRPHFLIFIVMGALVIAALWALRDPAAAP